MFRLYVFLCCFFLFLSTSSIALCDSINPDENEVHQCKQICSNSYLLLPFSQDSQTICQRGCRFFNIIDIKEAQNNSTTKDECHISCIQSYGVGLENEFCVVGCNAMLQKKEDDLQKLFPYLNDLNTDEQDIDSIEADIFLDPLIRKQLQTGYDFQYKIPEAYIRTIPVDENYNNLIENPLPRNQIDYQLVCSKMFTAIMFVGILILIITYGIKIVASLFIDRFPMMLDEESVKIVQHDKCTVKIDDY